MIDNSLSITIACGIMAFFGFVWLIEVFRILFASNTAKIAKIGFNGLKWTILMTVIMWGLYYFQDIIDYQINM